MREIVTVQVGSFANFIGSHFWNLQDELLGLADDPASDAVFKNYHQHLNMDVFYRNGETQQGTFTYTPRLISIGSQGSLGCISSDGTLCNEGTVPPPEIITWNGKISSIPSESRKKNLFLQRLHEEELRNLSLNETKKTDGTTESKIEDRDIVESLENGVQYWTDFSKVQYHPQSLYEVCGLWMDTEEFNNYGAGRDISSSNSRGDEINERLRFFVEECDHIQGFQFIVDDSGGFSALAADFLENIADEYTNTPVLLYSARGPSSQANPTSRKQTVSRNIHDAISFSRLASFSKLIVPIGLPFLSKSKVSVNLCIKDEKPYHCSAVYAAALHSISLPFRMNPIQPISSSNYVSGAMDVYELVQMLAGQDRQNIVNILDVAMPAPPLSETGKQVEQSLLGNLQPLMEETAEVEDFMAIECMTVHGAIWSGGRPASISEIKDQMNSAYENAPAQPKFCHLSATLCPLPIPLPFPSLFSNTVGQQGEILGSPIPGPTVRGSLDVHSIPMAARLRSSNAILPFLENRLLNLRRYGTERGALGAELLRSWGFAKEEVEELEENLHKMVSTLDDRYRDSADSDSD